MLADFEDPDEAALIAFDSVGVLGGGAPSDELGAGVRRARIFAGHSGWGPGQLDGELERGDWILEPARYSDAFTTDRDVLWSVVLTQGRQLCAGGAHA